MKGWQNRMAITNVWELIQKLYQKKHGIPPEVLDLIAVKPILMKCASGYSVARIAAATGNPVKYVIEVLNDYFNFPGWDDDLDFNPLAIYNRCNGDFFRYDLEVQMASPIAKGSVIGMTFALCRGYCEYKKEIEKYYE
jgi:hypothetical protein